jgi:hypothetical protein
MGEFELVTAVVQNYPILGFVLMIYYYSRRDHADMLRREQQFSAEIMTLVKDFFTSEQVTVQALNRIEQAIIELRNQSHENKNAIQRNTYEVGRLSLAITGKPYSEDKP